LLHSGRSDHDDLELAEFFATPLSVVSPNPAAMGEVGARLLWRRLDGVPGPVEKVVLPAEPIA
jgi:DNA-binding LacI/PurR family transcriptional regulator